MNPNTSLYPPSFVIFFRRFLNLSLRVQGIEHILSEIENSKSGIMNYCIKENDEIFEVSQIVNKFYEKYSQVSQPHVYLRSKNLTVH